MILSFTLYDLHSGSVYRHFSDRELRIGCTKPKVGLNYISLSKASMLTDAQNF
jgi:hypothetical protein